jgi:hypothetical protein
MANKNKRTTAAKSNEHEDVKFIFKEDKHTSICLHLKSSNKVSLVQFTQFTLKKTFVTTTDPTMIKMDFQPDLVRVVQHWPPLSQWRCSIVSQIMALATYALLYIYTH